MAAVSAKKEPDDVLFIVRCEQCGHETELTVVTSSFMRTIRKLLRVRP